jgi:N-acetylglucosamine kinase-like BadF-type ATPase
LLFIKLTPIFLLSMNHSLYVIGIDGGGTKTSAILCALDGTILSEAQGGPSNVQTNDIKQIGHTITDLIETCCHSMGCNISQIGAIVAGLAGAGRLADQKRIIVQLQEESQQRDLTLNNLIVESDARCALEGALNGKPGIVVIAGTGSIVVGKDEKGKIYRAGGWGKLIGDDGSGYYIGREALRAVAQTLDGYGEKTRLRRLLDERLGFSLQENIIDAVYKQNFDIASLAPFVIEAASGGDKKAKGILTNASNDLCRTIQSVMRAMNKSTKKVSTRFLSFSGSLIANDNWYSKKLKSTIKRELPLISIHPAESSPVVGAAIMAIDILSKRNVVS